MQVVSTQRSQVLASRIAQNLNIKVADMRFSRFPDGEHYLQVGDRDGDTVIVGSVVDSDALVQLLLLIDACADSKTTLVIPYMGYARQDKQFKSGEPLSARAIARALSSGVDQVITLNIHQKGVLSHFNTSAKNLSLATDIAACIKGMELNNPLILAPDRGAAAFATEIASLGAWDCDYLQKTRISGEEVRMEPVALDASGRCIVIVDDIISTGGTLATAAQMLYGSGAREVRAVCVHGIFAGGAFGHLRNAGITDIISSDTVESASSNYSAAPRVAAEIRGC
jgi:ribose-phosphate pyrophosphokinase